MSRLCCFSRRKCKSFPIHEKQRETEVNKIFVRHVESIRVIPTTKLTRQEKIKTKSRATIKTEPKQQTKNESIGGISSSQSRMPLSKLFQKSNTQFKTPSPLPITVDDTPEEKQLAKTTIANTSSNWSLSTDSDSNQHKKSGKDRSRAESYDLSKENTSQQKKTSNDMKPSGKKSKVILENVRKMIKDQHIQQQQQQQVARL